MSKIHSQERVQAAKLTAAILKNPIRFSEGNSKLQQTLIWNIPAVLTCPFATDACKEYCYTIKSERMYPSVLPRRFRHLQESQQQEFEEKMIEELHRQAQRKTKTGKQKFQYVRIHESGDFYSQAYVDKWARIAKACPDLKFLAYTKSYLYDFTELQSLPNVTIRMSLDSTSKQKAFQTSMPKAYVRTEETIQKLPQTTDKRQTIQCNVGMKCHECRLCWTSNKDVAFELH